MSKSKHFNGQADRVDKMAVDAYAPPDEKQRSEHIVDVVCQIIDDDGPRPMRDCRPTQKSRNAADQFDSDHQGAYEARAQPSRDRIQAVKQHNSAYPQMRDELNRKRSTAKITMMNAQRSSAMQQANYNRCNACIRYKKRAEPKKRLSVIRYPRERKKKSRLRQSGTRVTKPKTRQRARRSPCRIYRLSKIRTNRGCQCSAYLLAKDKKSGTNDILLNLEQPQKMAEDAFACRDLKANYTEAYKKQSKTSQYSKESSKIHNHNPDSDPSVSSYNSYASLDDEPMVSN
ncbi:hypothetical protein ABMA28_012906 [Loxostege sticticalis]|uniref:Uncharacterized protein n=1 Tax=Loxostege sticticalis TaxID=481309 RepID=A0ABD0S561_LOXSC